jgi:hypothetical protein
VGGAERLSPQSTVKATVVERGPVSGREAPDTTRR